MNSRSAVLIALALSAWSGAIIGAIFAAAVTLLEFGLRCAANDSPVAEANGRNRPNLVVPRPASDSPKMVYRGGCGSVSNDERASPSGTMIGSRSA